jgi:hypothetical protein
MNEREKRIESGRFAVALSRSDDHPGGMGWIESAAKLIEERDARIRAEARAEALREAAEKICLLDDKLPAMRRSSYQEGYGDALNDAGSAILADEPKEERGAKLTCETCYFSDFRRACNGCARGSMWRRIEGDGVCIII